MSTPLSPDDVTGHPFSVAVDPDGIGLAVIAGQFDLVDFGLAQGGYIELVVSMRPNDMSVTNDAVHRGEELTLPGTIEFALEYFEQLSPVRSKVELRGPAGLTAREAEVVRLVATGHRNREIAEALVLSVRTVETHLLSAYGKMGVSGRAAAGAWAVRNGLVPGGDQVPD